MATYKGTKITGTSTTAKVFRHSGVKKAKKGQTYHNTSVGHNYKCTKAGGPNEAKWKYEDTSIIKKPSLAVKSLGAPARSGYNMTATWKIPGDLVDKKQCDRATGLDITWYLGMPGKDPKKVVHTGNENLTTSTINLNNYKVGNTTYTRQSFYPFTGTKLSYVSVKVVPKNGKGNGKEAKQQRNFSAPRAPSISGFSFDSETGVISCTVDTDPGNDYQERYDTKYKMTITDTRTGQTWNKDDAASTSTSIGLSYNVSDYQQISYSQYVRVTVEAYARGYAGDSGKVSRTAYVSYPAQATILGVDVTGKTGADKCTVRINTNNTTEHPVDRVRLEYLADCDYATESSIPGGESWTESNIVDDASCTALALPVSNVLPSRGKYTWVRVMSWHYNEDVLYRMSKYVRVRALETPAPTAADDEITIIAASPGADGESIVVILGWNADGQDDSDGTELTWSEEEDTWKSTKTPDSHTFSWSDGSRTVGSTTYRDSATITIKGLEQGTKYYVKARRYMEGEKTTYSPYSNTATAITSETPESIVASCDRYVPEGKSLPVYWTFSGKGVQKKWQIVDSKGTVIESGTDTITSTQLRAERLEALAVNNSLVFTVQVSTGSGFVVSEEKQVTIIEPPELEITGSSLIHKHEEAERDFSGDIVTFEPKAAETVKSLTATINPKQDLHGYDKPWVGGAGKNMLDTSSMSTAGQSGVTFSRASDGVITIGGKANTTVYRLIGSIQTENGVQYTITGTPSGGASGKYRMTVAGYGYDYGSGYTFTGDGNAHDISVDIYTGYPSSGTLTFKPMVRLASVSDATFEPYSNICPISGWDGVSATRSGKNLLDVVGRTITSYVGVKNIRSEGGTASKDGDVVTQVTSGIWSKLWFEIDTSMLKVGQSFTFSATIDNPSGNRVNVGYRKGSSWTSGTNTTETHVKKSITFTPDSSLTNDFYFAVYTNNTNTVTNATVTVSEIQLELGATATAYEPYQADTYTTDLPETVYGGSLDVVSGVLTVDRAMVDLGSLDWIRNTNSHKTYFQTVAEVSDMKKSTGNTNEQPILCSNYETESWSNALDEDAYDGVVCEGWAGKSYIAIADSAKASLDAGSFKTAMSGVQLVYELAEPRTIQLTPKQVTTLLGENNVWADSGDVDVKLSEILIDEDQLQTNNLSLTFKSNSLCDIKLIVTSQGAVGQFPDGVKRQTVGDTIHSAIYAPVWTATDGGFSATVNLPTALDFWDLGLYTVSAVGIDRRTGLMSEEALLSFHVAWAHQAVDIRSTTTYSASADTTVDEDKTYYSYDSTTQTYNAVDPIGSENPSSAGWFEATTTNYVTLTPIDTIDATGYHRLAVEIALVPPPGSAETDLYDIYRLTGDGAILIGESFPLTVTTTDEYAPFGEDMTLHYRIAIRTIDGDVAFSDFEYVQNSSNLRFDWATGFVEFPYNLSIGDSYKKDVEFRSHLDGGIDGYWNQNIERNGKLSTDVIRVNQQEDIDKTRALARYAGPVFVRTPEGTAYEADVQVSDMSGTNNKIMAIAIDATEVSVTDEFLLPTPYKMEGDGD